ncbi:MAG: hypothetical protein IIW26_02945, partial [Tidjanibacter sp.]|nr:hypothetical protein [Tidjanibacter sp.]
SLELHPFLDSLSSWGSNPMIILQQQGGFQTKNTTTKGNVSKEGLHNRGEHQNKKGRCKSAFLVGLHGLEP